MGISSSSARVLIILIVGAIYCNLAQLGLVGYDDVDFIEHPAIEDGVSAGAVRHAFSATTLWHPITWLSHALDRSLFAAGLSGPHLINGALHLGSCLLLFSWLRRFAGEGAFSLVVTLLFAAHPLRVESVAWLAERKDVLATFFYLAAIYAYSVWTQASSRRWVFWVSVLAAVCGSLSKPSLMTLPVALLLIDAWPLDRLRRHLRIRLVEKWPFFVLAIGVAVVTLYFFGEDEAGISLGLWERISLSVVTMATYTWRSFCPIGLAAFEPLHTPEAWLVGISAAFLVAVTILAIRFRSTAPAFLMGWIWWLALLFPVSGIGSHSDNFAPDRYTYLAHIGLFVAVVATAEWFVKRFRIPRAVVGGGAVVAILTLSVLAFQQVGHWNNAETLWRHTLSVTRKNHVAHHQLGLHLLGTERSEEGLTHLRLAVAATPNFPVPRGNLALALARNGHPAEALAEFRAAGPGLPQRSKFAQQLEEAFKEAGATEALREILYQQVKETPESPDLNYRLALAFLNDREIAPAIRYLEEVLKFCDPDSLLAGRAHHALAQASTVAGDFSRALAEYQLALPLNPDLPVVRQEYAQLLLNAPDPAQRNPANALELMEPLADSDNPRFLRTLVQAKLENRLNAVAETNRGLEVVAQLRESDPLPQPWTESELAALQTWFEQRTSEP